MKDITVYWCSPILPVFNPGIDHAYNDLSDIVKEMKDSDADYSASVRSCPAAISHIKNSFRVKSTVNYDLTWDGTNITSSQKDQKFFDDYVRVRDIKAGLFSLQYISLFFFTEEPSLLMEVKNPIYARNTFRKIATFMEGSYDIGKWYRNTDLSFFIREKNTKLDINCGDSIFYVNFLTERKVKLKQYCMTDKLARITKEFIDSRSIIHDNFKNIKFYHKMHDYYYAFKMSNLKPVILKEIKNNLME